MEDLIKKLLDSKLMQILSGTSLGAIGCIVAIIIMVMNGIIGLPLYLMIGGFMIFAFVLMIISMLKYKQGNGDNEDNIKLPEKFKDLIDVLEKYQIEPLLLVNQILQSKKREKLLNHEIFNDEKSEYEIKIKTISQHKDIRSRGQAFLIEKFLTIKLNTMLVRIKEHIEAYESIIEDDYTKRSLSGIITVVNNAINSEEKGQRGYEVMARGIGIPKKFISEFNRLNSSRLEMFKSALDRIKDIIGLTDYYKYLLVFVFLKLYFDEVFSNQNIDQIIDINGELEDIYNYTTELINDDYDESTIFKKLKKEFD